MMPEEGGTHLSESSDAALIALVRAGETGAFEDLYARHIEAARRLAAIYVRQPAGLEDLCAESFARVLDVLRRGGGPEFAFRPYLLTVLRNVAGDWARGERRMLLVEGFVAQERHLVGEPADPAVDKLERSLAARAFARLPERWQAVLWHTEVEGQTPAHVAPIMGLTPGAVSALAYRAREGLRQAYLQAHLAETVAPECRPYADRLGAYLRNSLGARERLAVEKHIDACDRCHALYLELGDVNASLGAVVAPAVVGTFTAADYVGTAALPGTVAGGGAGGGAPTGGPGRTQTARQIAAAVAILVALLAGGAFALVALSGDDGQAPRADGLASPENEAPVGEDPTPPPAPPSTRPPPERPSPSEEAPASTTTAAEPTPSSPSPPPETATDEPTPTERPQSPRPPRTSPPPTQPPPTGPDCEFPRPDGHDPREWVEDVKRWARELGTCSCRARPDPGSAVPCPDLPDLPDVLDLPGLLKASGLDSRFVTTGSAPSYQQRGSGNR